MTDVTVFVDDAVRGTLPGVCAKDGVETSSGMTIRTEVGAAPGIGLAWLLVLTGPIGLLALIVIGAMQSSGREVLTIQVPMSEPAYSRVRRARRMQNVWCAVAVLATLAAVAALVGSDGTLLGRAGVLGALVLAVVGTIGLIASGARLRRARVAVELDGSRRWVTLSDVHPAFAAACTVQAQLQSQRT